MKIKESRVIDDFLEKHNMVLKVEAYNELVSLLNSFYKAGFESGKNWNPLLVDSE